MKSIHLRPIQEVTATQREHVLRAMGRSQLMPSNVGAVLLLVHNTFGRQSFFYILPKPKDPAAVKLGRKGGKEIAK